MTSNHVLGVLDLTFLDITDENDMLNGINQRLPLHESTSPTKMKRPEVIKAIRLANNDISSIEMVAAVLSTKLDLNNILWLDLSFNAIEKIPIELSTAFPKLATIYLHANQLTKLSELKKLGNVPNLKALSLYGNPVEEHKHYRNYVLYKCSKLTQFDMSPVTKSELQKMAVWCRTYRNKLNATEEVEN